MNQGTDNSARAEQAPAHIMGMPLSPLVALALGLAVLRFAHLGLYLGLKPSGGEVDFRPPYTAAKMVVSGTGADVYDNSQNIWYQERYTGQQGTGYMPYLYPPPALFLYLPFSLLPFPLAAKLWLLVNLGALALALHLSLGFVAEHREAKMAVLCMFLLLPATSHTLRLGQINIWVLLCLLAMIRSLAERRDAAAGVLLAAAMMLKVTPGIFLLYLVAQRRWKAALACLLGSAGLLGAAWVAFGHSASPAVLAQRLPAHSAWAAGQPNNQSLCGLLCDIGVAQGRAIALALAGLLVVVTVLVWLLTYRSAPSAERIALDVGLGAVVSLLISPCTMPHHYMILLISLTALFSVWPYVTNRPLTIAMACACIGGLSLQYDLERPGEGLLAGLQAVLGYPWVLWALVLWLLLMLVILLRPRPAMATSAASPQCGE